MAIKQYQSAGGVVVQRGIIDGLELARAHILLLDRPDRNEVRLPKGHIDPGEDAQTAAIRETQEEAGFADLTVLADLGKRTVEFDYKDDHFIRDEHYFLMELGSARQCKRPEQDERQFRPLWVALEHAAEMLTFESEQRVVRAAVVYYMQMK